MSKHTPAPWTVNTTDYTNAIGIECVVNGIAHTVCTDQFCYPNFQQHGSEEKLANAKIIAAAPELFEACNIALRYFNGIDTESQSEAAFHALNNAIKKATL